MDIDSFKGFVGLSLDDLNKGVIVDLTSKEHLLEFTLDVEWIQDALTEIKVFLNSYRELCFLLIYWGYAHLLKLDWFHKIKIS